jgi:hypothetical protein
MLPFFFHDNTHPKALDSNVASTFSRATICPFDVLILELFLFQVILWPFLLTMLMKVQYKGVVDVVQNTF